MEPGPKTRAQLARLNRTWKQGEHVLVSGPTGSGKTALVRHIVELRARRGGYVLVMCAKPLEDETIANDYLKNGFVRWKRWRQPRSWEHKIVLWPDVSKAKGNAHGIKAIQREIFEEAFDAINDAGHWTVQIDEGLYTVHPSFLGLFDQVAMGHSIGRSGNLTYVTLVQRPANLPVIVYGSASHVFVGRTRETDDLKRLKEIGGKEGSKVLGDKIAALDRHQFMWIPVAPDWPAEIVDLSK
jgi:energy-coupling factor transporter ATP-binding protein EcfA2